MDDFRELASMIVTAGSPVDAGIVAAPLTDIARSMMRRDHLWDGCHSPLTQAAAANYQLVEAVQQPVVDVVLAVRGHMRAPRVHDLFFRTRTGE